MMRVRASMLLKYEKLETKRKQEDNSKKAEFEFAIDINHLILTTARDADMMRVRASMLLKYEKLEAEQRQCWTQYY